MKKSMIYTNIKRLMVYTTYLVLLIVLALLLLIGYIALDNELNEPIVETFEGHGDFDGDGYYEDYSIYDYANREPWYSCNWDWTYSTQKQIDNLVAPYNYTFVVCTIYIQNNDDTKNASANSYSWDLIADGVTYNSHSITYSDEISHNPVDIVGYGEEIETQIVYLLPENATIDKLVYAENYPPMMNHIVYYHDEEFENLHSSMLQNIKSEGYDIDSIEYAEVGDFDWHWGIGVENLQRKIMEREMIIFHTNQISDAAHIYDIGAIAYETLNGSRYEQPDYFVVHVGNESGKAYMILERGVFAFKGGYDEHYTVYVSDRDSTIYLDESPDKLSEELSNYIQ